jgi:glycosyltransferase involved in cell wall biosynthesis
MSPSLQFVLPTSEMRGDIRLPVEIAEWLTDYGWTTRLVGPGPRPDWHATAVPWFSHELEGAQPLPRADVTIATFYTTVEPALRSGSGHVFHLCQGFEGLHPEYEGIRDAIDAAYRAPIPKLVVSQHLEPILVEHHPGVRCHFIGEAVDSRIFFPLGIRNAPTPLRVGLVGTFSARVKGIREGLEGARLARDKGLELEVHRASAEEMTEEEASLGQTDHFHHRLPTTRMPAFYGGVDVLLFPSQPEEGFGLPVLEALSCGVPVAHSDIPSLEVIPSEATLRFPPGDAKAIAHALGRLAADTDLRRFLRRAGLEVAHEYRPQALVARLQQAFADEGCLTV